MVTRLRSGSANPGRVQTRPNKISSDMALRSGVIAADALLANASSNASPNSR